MTMRGVSMFMAGIGAGCLFYGTLGVMLSLSPMSIVGAFAASAAFMGISNFFWSHK